MRALSRFLMLGIACLFICPSNLSANQLPLFLERADGLQFQKQKDFLGAIVRFKVLLILLEHIQVENPAWEHDLVAKDVADSKAKIIELEPLAAKQISEMCKVGSSTVAELYQQGVLEPDALKAMHLLVEYNSIFETWHQQFPRGNFDNIPDRTKESQERITQLAPKVLEDALPKPGDGHTMQ